VNIHDKNKENCSSLFIATTRGHIDVMKLLLSKGASIYDRYYDGRTCLAGARTPEAKHLLKNWVATMLLIVLQELCALSGLDASSFLDLRRYMG
jgi:ankyrin repeat protein